MRAQVHRLRRFVFRAAGLSDGAETQSFSTALLRLIASDLGITAAGFVFTAALVRAIGPAEFGKANLIVSVSQFLLVPLMFGLPAAAARFLADRQSAASISTFVAAQLLVILVVAPVLFVSSGLLSRQLGVTRDLYAWGLGYALLLSWQLLSEGIMGGLREFARLARLNVISGALFIAATVATLLTEPSLDFRHFVGLSAVRWTALVLLAGWWVRSRLGRVEWSLLPTYLHFGLYQAASALTHFFVLGSIDSVMLNAYHGLTAVGLYGADHASFNVVISRFMRIFSTVFLPTATAHGDRRRLLRQLMQAYVRSAWILIPVVIALSFFLFRFYGPEYSFSVLLAALMGVCVTLHVGVAILIDLSAAEGLAGVRRNLTAAVLTALINVAANLALIPTWGVGGTMTATIIAFGCGLAYRYTALVRLHRANGRET